MSGSTVTVQLAINKQTYTAALKSAAKDLDALAGKSKAMGHSTVSSMQASSAAIRLFEGEMQNNVRAVERFITTIPGVGTALKAAFPLVGGLAFAGLIARMGEEVVAFIQKTNGVPKAIQQAFAASNLSITESNDELQKSNDTLANQIALLQGKPVNNAAIALDDARIAADKLAKSLMEDNRQLASLLKEQSIGAFAGLITNQASTGATAGLVQYWSAELQKRAQDVVAAQHQHGVGSTEDLAAQAALEQRQKDAEASVEQHLTRLQSLQADHDKVAGTWQAGTINDQSGNIGIAQGYLTGLYGRDNQASLEKTNAQEQAQQKKLEDARKYADQQKQLAAQRLQAMEEELNQRKNVEQLDAADEYAFWAQKLSTLKTGDANYREVLAKAAPAYQAALREHNEIVKDAIDKGGMFLPGAGNETTPTINWERPGESLSASPDFKQSQESQNKNATDYLKQLNEGVAIQRQNAQAIAETSLQIAIATGQMSKLDAAQAQAKLHADEYADALQRAQATLADAQINFGVRSPQAIDAQNQIDKLNGQRDVDSMKDQQAIKSASAMDQLQQSIAALMNKFTDFGAQISELTTQAIEGLNQALSSSLMAHAYNGREYRQNITNSIAGSLRQTGSKGMNDALQEAEGGVYHALTGKTLTHGQLGSKTNPSYTNVVNMPQGSSGGDGSGSGTGSTTSQQGGGGFFGSILGAIFGGGKGNSQSYLDDSGYSSDSGFDTDDDPWQGAFAGGGDVVADRPALVGEMGPEVFVPHTSGTIIPNHALGGDTNHYHYVDARGSNDPAATEAAVHRAMRRYVPAVVAASQAKSRDSRLRKPSSARS